MKMRIRRFIAALLVLALALGLTGCSKDGQDETENLVFQYAPNYIAEDIPLPADTGVLEGSCTDGKNIWFLVTPETEAPPVLCRVPLDGGEAEILADYRLPEVNEDTITGYLGPILGGDGKLWMWEQFFEYKYDLPEGFDTETDAKGDYFTGTVQTWQMRQLDPATGRELSAVDITAAMEQLDGAVVCGMAVDKDGYVCLAGPEQVTVTSSQGQLLFTLEGDLPANSISSGSAGGTLALLPDGRAAALVIQPGGMREVLPINTQAQDWGEAACTLPATGQIYSGKGDCTLYYMRDGVLYSVVEGAELPQYLLPWSNAQLEEGGSVQCFALLEEGRVAVLTCTYENGSDLFSGQVRALLLSPTDEVPEDRRVKLVYGMIGENDSVRIRVRNFNKKSENYYIELRDYAEGMLYNTGDYKQAYQNAVTRLYAEIAAGRTPDIMDLSLPLSELAKQGAMEDLWPWIENDPELGRDGVMAHVLECLETDGKLYRICGSFTIQTAVASAEIAGGRTGWTMEEMLDAFGGEMPELYFGSTSDVGVAAGFARYDRDSMMFSLLDMSLSRYVDWGTGECSFDGEDFKAILRLCGDTEEAEYNEEDRTKRLLMGFSHGVAGSLEPCQVSPWEGEPVLYARTLAKPQDLLVDDVLFGGRDSLWDYEQQLWDADILYSWISPYNGRELHSPRIKIPAYGYIGDIEFDKKYGLMTYHKGGYPEIAADAVSGAMDGNVYAAYVGFPAESGTGSSFTVSDLVGVSASGEAKEGAWEFVRELLLPEGNLYYFSYDGKTDSTSMGFPMNRGDFEAKFLPEPQWCVNEETGAYYLDSSGNKVECSMDCMAIGDPAVMLVYQTAPSQAQKDRFWNLYNSIEHISGGNNELMTIIIEQAAPYFAGDKSLDETAQLIQNRVQLYVNENR
ncbi:MAG: hypothetical protein HDT18_03585 [Oscillibacter sp.]|nr:hypothetical protein [Oscillibacter sp.]